MHSAKRRKKFYVRCTVAEKNWKEAKLTCKRKESELFNYGDLEISPSENFGIRNSETLVSTFSM